MLTLRKSMPTEHPRPSARRWPKLAAGVGLATFVAVVALLFGSASKLTFPLRTWTFQEPEGDLAALGLRFSHPEGGEWRLVDHEGASGNRALVNLAGLPRAAAASAIVTDGLARD